MEPKDDIQKLFQQILGVKLKIEENPIDNDKEVFCRILDAWILSWEKQQYLYEMYQLDLQGYDNVLYEIIDSFIFLYFKNPKVCDLISWYVYERKNTFGDETEYAKLYNIEDNSKEIDINTSEKFWSLLQDISAGKLNIEDLEIIGIEEDDEDE
jgi:hypothetical protein